MVYPPLREKLNLGEHRHKKSTFLKNWPLTRDLWASWPKEKSTKNQRTINTSHHPTKIRRKLLTWGIWKAFNPLPQLLAWGSEWDELSDLVKSRPAGWASLESSRASNLESSRESSLESSRGSSLESSRESSRDSSRELSRESSQVSNLSRAGSLIWRPVWNRAGSQDAHRAGNPTWK